MDSVTIFFTSSVTNATTTGITTVFPVNGRRVTVHLAAPSYSSTGLTIPLNLARVEISPGSARPHRTKP